MTSFLPYTAKIALSNGQVIEFPATRDVKVSEYVAIVMGAAAPEEMHSYLGAAVLALTSVKIMVKTELSEQLFLKMGPIAFGAQVIDAMVQGGCDLKSVIQEGGKAYSHLAKTKAELMQVIAKKEEAVDFLEAPPVSGNEGS